MAITQEMEQTSVWTRTVVSIPMLYFSTSIWICTDVNTYWVIGKKKKRILRENWSKVHQKFKWNPLNMLGLLQNFILHFCPSIQESVLVCRHDPKMFPVLHPQGILGCMTRVWPAIFHDAVLHQSDKTVLPLQPKHSLICSMILDALNLSVFDVSWAG